MGMRVDVEAKPRLSFPAVPEIERVNHAEILIKLHSATSAETKRKIVNDVRDAFISIGEGLEPPIQIRMNDTVNWMPLEGAGPEDLRVGFWLRDPNRADSQSCEILKADAALIGGQILGKLRNALPYVFFSVELRARHGKPLGPTPTLSPE